MTQWTEQPDGTWRRGPLVVRNAWDPWGPHAWTWECGPDATVRWSFATREEAQAAADAWAADMLAQLKQLDTPSNPGENLAHEPGRV